MNITAPERSALIRSSAYTWSWCQEGVDGQTILSNLYCSNLEDKTPAQGALMTRELCQWIARFQNTYDAVLEDPAGYPAHVLQEALEAVPAEQQCQLLTGLIRAWGPEEPAVPQTRDALLAAALESLSAGADGLERFLPSAGADELREREQVKFRCGPDMTLAVNAMTCYTLAQSGELPPLPGDGSLAQTAIGVCAEDLLCSIRRDAQEGYLPAKEAAQRRCALLKAFRLTLLLASGLALLTAPALGLLGTLGVCGGLVAALSAVIREKSAIDCRMLKEEADDLPPIFLELPHCPVPWSKKQPDRASRPETAPDACQEETQEIPEEYIFRPL